MEMVYLIVDASTDLKHACFIQDEEGNNLIFAKKEDAHNYIVDNFGENCYGIFIIPLPYATIRNYMRLKTTNLKNENDNETDGIYIKD